MCDIAVCIAKAQDDAEMDWHAYEIKLGTLTVSLSTVYCKFDFLNVCIVFLHKSLATGHYPLHGHSIRVEYRIIKT